MPRATKKTEPVEPVAVQEPLADLPLYERRPGDVVVIASRRVLVGDRALNSPYTTENWLHAVETDIPTLLPYRLFRGRDDDGFRLERDGTLQVVEGERGVIPQVIDGRDGWAAQAFLTNERPRINRQQFIDHWQGIVVDRSLAESIVMCLDAGVPEDVAVGILVQTYDQSFLEQRATDRPWIAAAQSLMAQQRNAEGGES